MAAPAKNLPPKNESHVTPQVATLIHRDVVEGMEKQYQFFLANTLTTAAFRLFCQLQMERIKDDLMKLTPRPEWSDEEFTRVSKDMRLVWRFWNDLLEYATDLTKQNRAQNDGEE